MKGSVDIAGRVFARLTAIELLPRGPGDKAPHWRCRCECGTETRVNVFALLSGGTRSCGCFQRERASATASARRKHGYSAKGFSRTYRIWMNMRARCENPTNISWPSYGGRGITVCESWASSFSDFLKDMGEAPAKHSLERIDVNGNYVPANCKWATSKEQNNNRRDNHRLTIRGEERTIAQWGEQPGAVRAKLIYQRIASGWDPERAVFQRVGE